MPPHSKGRISARHAGLAALALAVFTPACQKDRAALEPALQTVRAGTVQEIRPDAPERYSATIVPSAQVDLAFKSGGLVATVLQIRGADGRMRNVEVGDKVPQGAELAVVRQVDYTQRVDQAQQQAGQAEAQLAAAEALFQQAELDYTRAGNLYKTASLTKPDYDAAKARYDSAGAQIAAAKAALGAARTQVSQAQLGLSDTVLRAPIAGWITARNVDVGSLVGGSMVGFSMVDTSVVKAMFAVSDTSLKSVHMGQRLAVNLESLGRPVSGTVTALSPEADPKSRVFTVEVSVPNPSDDIRPGMIGSIALGAQTEPRARLVVPLSAVVRAPANGNAFAVFRIEEHNGATFAAAREITVGETYGNSIEVTSGLVAGDRIIALGGALLRDGQQVRVL